MSIISYPPSIPLLQLKCILSLLHLSNLYQLDDLFLHILHTPHYSSVNPYYIPYTHKTPHTPLYSHNPHYTPRTPQNLDGSTNCSFSTY